MTAQLAAEKPIIRILLYSDDPRSITNGTKLLGLSSMIERLKAHAPTFADLDVQWKSRSSSDNNHAENKLNVLLEEAAEDGKPFDEIWFFGLHQINTEPRPLSFLRGGPQDELEPAEIEALRCWMKIADDGTGGGGVLMTGDHNNPAPPSRIVAGADAANITDDTLLGLGRAIGRGVPRAGALRQWVGPPSSLRRESLNTLTVEGFQTDPKPQKLEHVLDSNKKAHPLFFYRGTNEFIERFPDHGHEGALVIPDTSDPVVWPSGQNGKPQPAVIAFGRDRVRGKRVDILSAYDGDSADVGRIVADSSWHHYVNINLKGLPHPAPVPSDSDQIGQFYGNLAVWLAPRHKRQQMAQAMAWELADYTRTLERPEDASDLGNIADVLLQRAAAPCEVHELLKALALGQIASERFSDGSTLASNEDLRKETLGAVLWSYHTALDYLENAAATLNELNPAAVINQGFTNARATRRNGSRSESNRVSRTEEERSTNMACGEEEREWTIEMKNDLGEATPFKGTLVFCLNNQKGIVTGKVSDGVKGELLSAVTGSHQPAFQTESVGFMSVDFIWNGTGVNMAGATLKTPETIFFDGRFRTESPANGNGSSGSGDARAIPLGDGDTGTSVGQTT